MKTRQFVLASRPNGLPSSENFRPETKNTDELKENEVLLKSWFISVDPYMRGRMRDAKSYAASFEVDQPIRGGVVATVVESRSSSFIKGDSVVGNLPWATYSVERAEHLKKVDTHSVDPGYYLGILGMPGLTAYFGITDIGKPKAWETVVISGAAGAVGITAGQIAKMQGAFVVGIAGTDEKCNILKDEFGFDAAVNYKTSKVLRKTIAEVCPKGVDVYFDNVGGEITDAVIANLNNHSRIILCGQISQYNMTRIPTVPSILPTLLTKRVLLKGFIVSDYNEHFPEAALQMTKWVNDGTLSYRQTVVHGFDKLPDAFLGLFSGQNLGKMIVEVE
jgi:NADPH:quinone reductase